MAKKKSAAKSSAKKSAGAKKSTPAKRKTTHRTRKPTVDSLVRALVSNPNREASVLSLLDSIEKHPELIEAAVIVAGEAPLSVAIGILQEVLVRTEPYYSKFVTPAADTVWSNEVLQPWLLAQYRLASAYDEAGQSTEAIGQLERLLQHDPADEMEIRYQLLSVLLRVGNVDGAAELTATYDDDLDIIIVMTDILIRYIQSGASEQLKDKLVAAIELNPYVVPRLMHATGSLLDDDWSSDPGSPEEAEFYARMFMSVWRSTPGAITWLKRVTYGMDLPDYPSDFGSLFDDDDDPLGRDKLVKRALKLDQSDEFWLILIEFSDDHTAVTILDEESERPVCLVIDDTDTDVYATILDAMSSPETGEPCRPSTFVVFDEEAKNLVSPIAERLNIAVEQRTNVPQILAMMKQSTAAISGDLLLSIDDLESIPIDADAIWVMDWRHLSLWIPDEETGEPTQPWMCLVLNAADGTILGQQLTMTQPDEDSLGATLAIASNSPSLETPTLPGGILVASADHRLSLKPLTDRLRIGCVDSNDTAEKLDLVFEDLTQFMAPGNRSMPSVTGIEGASMNLVEQFFEAAADFYRSRIWLSLRTDAVTEVRCPEILHGRWYAVVMGQMGQEIGMMLFDDPDVVHALMMVEDDDDARAGTVRQMHGIGFSLQEQNFCSPADVAACEQFGWPVAAPEAWPNTMFVSNQEFRSLELREFEFVIASVRAVQAHIQSGQIDHSTSVQVGHRTVQVETRSALA
ncbi:MAG: bacterial transcriptional activator domain-containing protein [Planctomycetaceae bacterium]|nr:bacterial transcriptional activator domain-containing protein [Planctomycetaceae bacterium]